MYSFYISVNYILICKLASNTSTLVSPTRHPLPYLPSTTTPPSLIHPLLSRRLSNKAPNLQGAHSVLDTSDKIFELQIYDPWLHHNMARETRRQELPPVTCLATGSMKVDHAKGEG